MKFQTSGVKYLGAKTRLLEDIVAAIGPASEVIDVFTGTTRVAQAVRSTGVRVTTCDISHYSERFSGCYVEADSCDVSEASEVIAELSLLGEQSRASGWMTQNYADVMSASGGLVRFIHPANAAFVDAVRDRIVELDLRRAVEDIAVTSLIEATDRVDNTVGIQQAYLKDWCARSLGRIEMRVPCVPVGPTGKHIRGDALSVQFPPADVAYVDPPYSGHNYATYYHIWDSLSMWDKPSVSLDTNRRSDRVGRDGWRSQWCSRTTALAATKRLLERLDVRRVVLSYSDDSAIMCHDELLELCSGFGKTDVVAVSSKRNVMSQIGNASAQPGPKTNHELLYSISMDRR